MRCSRPLGALALTLLVASACASSADSEAGAEPRLPTSSTAAGPTTTKPTLRVAIVGDSITVQAAPALRRQIDGAVSVAARRGARSIDMVAPADRLAAGGPDVVVVNLGTNDEACATVGGCSDGYRPDGADVAAGLRRIVEGFDGACRLGVTIAYGLEDPPMTNPVLDDMHRTGELDGVVDWNAHWRTAEPPGEQWLVDFEGHLSPAGAEALATLVADEIERVCRPR